MCDQLVLRYSWERGEHGDLSSGELVFRRDKAEDMLESFHKIDFITMMKKFARYLSANPNCHGVFERTDRPGLLPQELTEADERLFRQDPAEAIQRLIIKPITVHIGLEKTTTKEPT